MVPLVNHSLVVGKPVQVQFWNMCVQSWKGKDFDRDRYIVEAEYCAQEYLEKFVWQIHD